MKSGSIAASLVLSLALPLTLPQTVAAQTNDAQYCTTLKDTYVKYVMSRGSRGAKQGITADVGNALSDCDTGKVASAIPVLEKALRNAGFDLPPRG